LPNYCWMDEENATNLFSAVSSDQRLARPRMDVPNVQRPIEALAALRGQERPPQPYPNAALGLAFARGLWRPPQHSAQVDCGFLELIAGIPLRSLSGAPQRPSLRRYAARLATLAIVARLQAVAPMDRFQD
jgi:hypothetical protein